MMQELLKHRDEFRSLDAALTELRERWSRKHGIDEASVQLQLAQLFAEGRAGGELAGPL